MSKIIQITCCSHANTKYTQCEHTLYALFDDGQLMSYNLHGWNDIPYPVKLLQDEMEK